MMAALDRDGVRRMAVDYVDAVVPAFVDHRAAEAEAHERFYHYQQLAELDWSDEPHEEES